MEYRAKGFATVLTGQTTDPELDVALAAVRPAPSMVSAASLVTVALKRFALPIGAVIDARGGRVIATDNATMKAALKLALANANQKLTLRPVGGESGVALPWNIYGPTSSWDAMGLITPHVTAVKPRASAPALVQSVLSVLLDGFAVIDQSVPEIVFYKFNSDANAIAASAALAAVAKPSTGKAVAFELRDVETAELV